VFARTHSRALALALGAAFVPLTIAACGADESGKTPSQILQDASSATKTVTTYHVSGTGAGTSSTFDLRIGGPGAVSGSLTVSGVTAGVVIAKGAAYLKGKAYLEQAASPQVASLVGDNWLKLPSSSATDLTQSFAGITDTKRIAGCLVTGLNGLSLTKSTATVNGHSVVVVKASALALSFASSGPTYLMQVKSTGSTPAFENCLNGTSGSSSGSTTTGGGGTVNFDSWGTSVSITPPPHPVDLGG
jgi:hypothetical protein